MTDLRLLPRLTGKVLALVALFVALTAGTASAQEVCYVDTGGNDTFNGEAAQFNGTDGPNATIAGCLAEAYVADTDDVDLISIEAGTYAETVTVNSDVNFEARQTGSFTVVIITGGVEVAADNALTVRGNTEGGFQDGVFEFQAGITDAGVPAAAPWTANIALQLNEGSSLTIQDEVEGGRVIIPAAAAVVRDDDAAVSGTLTYEGAVHLAYIDNDGSDTDVTAGSELPADLDPADAAGGTLLVDIGANQVAITSLIVGGSAVNIADASGIDGTLVVDGNVSLDDEAAGGAAAGDFGTLDVNAGVVTVNASALEADNVDIANNAAITFALGAADLDVSGNFERLGGTFTAGATSTLTFSGDAANGLFNPGPNFSIGAVVVDKNGRTLDVNDDFTVTGTGPSFTIASGTTVELGGETVTVAAAGTVDVDGTITNLATGGIVFTAGAALAGDGSYGNIFVVSAADVTVAATEEVSFAGILSLQDGGITVTAGGDISPVGDAASVVISTANTDTDITGSFNADAVPYDLSYSGALAAPRAVGQEFAPQQLVNVTFAFVPATAADILTLANGTNGDRIDGDVTLGEGALVELQDNVQIGLEGVLTISDDAVLSGDGDGLGGDTFTLAGDNTTHSIVGTITDVTLILDGENIVVNGSDNADDHEAEVAGVTIAEDATATATNLQAINGDLTVGSAAADDATTLSLTMADEQDVTGDLVAQGSSLTLGSDVNVGGDVAVNQGTLAFGSSNLTVDGNFAGAADVAYTADDGALVMNATGMTLGTNDEPIPNVVLENNVDVVLSSATIISQSLAESGSADIDINGNTLSIGGAVTTDGAIFVINGGAAKTVTLNTATITMSGDSGIDAPTAVAEGATVTLVTDDTATPTPRLLLIGDELTLGGTFALGINHLQLDGDLLNAEGTVTSESGEVQIGGNLNIEPDGELLIPHFTILAGGAVVGTATDGSVTVTGTLKLGASIAEADDNDDIILADGATIDVGAVTPFGADEPTFEGGVSLIYSVATASGEEVPDDGEGTVNDLDVDQSLVLMQDVTVNGTLSLADDIDNVTNEAALVLADGATLKLEADNAAVLGANAEITATNYTLVYETGADETISDEEFVDGATVTTLVNNVGAGFSLMLDPDRSVNNVILDSGTLQMAGNAFSIAGDLTHAGGVLVNGTDPVDDDNVALSFVGDMPQVLTLEGTGWTIEDIDITIEKSTNEIVTVAGPANARLNFFSNAETLFLNGGIVDTEDDVTIFLYQNDQTQGFDRTVEPPAAGKAAAAGEASHIAGNVTKRLMAGDPFGAGRSARFEFPTGSPDGEYRPYALTFRENITTQTDITVNHEDESPEGTAGLPRESGDDVYIGSYPAFYWLVDASTSLGQAQSFDVELTAAELGASFDNEDNLRIIRRFDGQAQTNEWSVQGDAANYDNFLQVVGDGDDSNTEPDTTVIARVTNSTGGLVPQGARYTLGLAVGFNAAPVFTATALDTNVEVGQNWAVQYEATDADGDTLTFSLVVGPEGASITDDGLFTWTPTEAQNATDSTYAITVVVTDGRSEVSHTANVTVGDVGTDIDNPSELPDEFALKGNYPNPFNPATTIRFDLPESAEVTLQVFDMLGRQVMALPAKTFQAGADQSFQVDASTLSSGVYVYRLIVNSTNDTMVKAGQMTLIK